MPARIGASTADEQPPCRARQLRELGKPTLQCPNQLSRPLASWLPPNRGHLNSNHVLGTLVPVEEPSTASLPDIRHRAADSLEEPCQGASQQTVSSLPVMSGKAASFGTFCCGNH